MFKELCGEAALANAQIVTTNWNRVSKEEGVSREEELVKVFKHLLDGGVRLSRHDKGIDSARSIMHDLVGNPAITTKIQLELKDGRPLASTSAGAVLTEEMKVLVDKHQKEMESLKAEIGEALRQQDDVLKAELEEECRAMQLKMAQLEEDRRRMERTARDDHLPVTSSNERREGHTMTPGGSEGESGGDSDRFSGSQSERTVMSDEVSFLSLFESIRKRNLRNAIKRYTKGDLEQLEATFQRKRDEAEKLSILIPLLRKKGVMGDLGRLAQCRQ